MKETLKSKLRGSLKSFVMWFNIVIAPLLILVEQNSSLWQSYLGNKGGTVLMIVIIVNGALRAFKTTSALEDK